MPFISLAGLLIVSCIVLFSVRFYEENKYEDDDDGDDDVDDMKTA